MIQGTESVGFTGPEARERQIAEFKRLKSEGIRGIGKHTTQTDGRIVYIVTWPRTIADIQNEVVTDAENLLKNDLTTAPASGSVVMEESNELGKQPVDSL